MDFDFSFGLFFSGMATALLGTWIFQLWASESRLRRQRAARELLTSYRLTRAPENADGIPDPRVDESTPPLDWAGAPLVHLNVRVTSLAESKEVHQALSDLELHPYVSVRSRFAPEALPPATHYCPPACSSVASNTAARPRLWLVPTAGSVKKSADGHA